MLLPLTGLMCALSPAAVVVGEGEQQLLRPPAVPLVTHDPYFSLWLFGDELAAQWPRHWTGAVQALYSVVRIDGRAYRLMGADPAAESAAKQVGLQVLPTQTVYTFEADGVGVTLTFTSPLLPDDLDLIARPVSYLTWEVVSLDGRKHAVQLYFDCTAELAVNKAEQAVTWSRPEVQGLATMRMGTEAQPVLEKDGDRLRIDWGWVYLAASESDQPRTASGAAERLRETFINSGTVPMGDDADKPRPARDRWPACACAFDLGLVGQESASRWLMLAYDDEYSIQYFGTNLRPWWRRDGRDAAALLSTAAADRGDLLRRCAEFDAQVRSDMTRVGGPEYADLCALAYRQAIAAHKLCAGPDGQPMLFSKECFSNGCIATVDVAYPASPLFALFSNDLLKAMVEPVFQYAAMDRWKFPFAPHDLGRYPKANGQRYGGGEKSEDRQMPVEESGNMLIMAAVISRIDGNVDYVRQYWPQLSQWAAYLQAKGLDPANQLCTDDFAGHLAHNVNLSAKALVALACYAELARLAGLGEEADEYRATAESFAKQWVKEADDGDHFRLAFDKPGTWSQKYNLVWDAVLGLNLFPPEVAAKEVAYYKTKLNRYGLPLDNRETYTKTDWEVWTATLAATHQDFESLMSPVYDFVSTTPDRVPLSDWYWTQDAKKRGFQARSVVGGVFIKALTDEELWGKWSGRSK